MILKEIQYTDTKGRKKLKIEFKCDVCGDIKCVDKYGFLKRKRQICNHCSTIVSGKKRRGIPSPFKGKERPELQGEKSHNWKGGKWIDKWGYVRIDGNRKRNGHGWYLKEHRVVAEKMIGRPLKKDECVHHIDGNKQNNAETNLLVTNNYQHHKLIHASLQEVAYELYKRGNISFNKVTNKYELIG